MPLRTSLVLAADDSRRLASFYGNLLGCQPKAGFSTSHWQLTWPGGGRLEIYQPSSSRPLPRQIGRLSLCLQQDCPDDKPLAQLQAWIADANIDVVLATGGTGVTGRDVTPEAFYRVYEKEIPGFGEVFRMLSFEKIGTSTIQSRATAGVAGGTYLFALPGSPGACRDAWDDILVHQLDYRFKPCNFVELMPRLMEK